MPMAAFIILLSSSQSPTIPCTTSVLQYHPVTACTLHDLSGTVVTNDWSTATIPLELGVYQGDPLSVVIFNTVINTMVDTLHTAETHWMF